MTLSGLPPKGQQTVRYYGLYSNKSRGQTSPTPDRIIRPAQPETPPEKPQPAQILLTCAPKLRERRSIPAPPKKSARDMRPLWRDLILKVWGGDPLQCPCCKGTMKPVRTFLRPEEIQFFLRLQGLWEGVIQLPRPPPPPFDIDTIEPIEPPWQAIKEWIPDDDPDLNWFNQERQPASTDPESFDQSPTWQPVEIPLDDGRILVLDDS